MPDFSNAVEGGSYIASANDFSTGWTLAGYSISVNSTGTLDPDGGNSSDLITIPDSTYRFYVIKFTKDFTRKTYNRHRIALKPSGINFARITLKDKTNTEKGAWFDLSLGVVSSVDAGVIAEIEPLSNGFYECIVTVNVGTGTSTGQETRIYFANTSGGSNGMAGPAGAGMYLYGAYLGQLSAIEYSIGSGGDYVDVPALVSAMTLLPGDKVNGQGQAFRASATWDVQDDGSAGNPIVLENFNLLGSIRLSGGAWELVSGTQYKIAETRTVTGLVIVDGDPVSGSKVKVRRAADYASMTAGTFWRDGTHLYVDLGGTDPGDLNFELCITGGTATLGATNTTRLLWLRGDYIKLTAKVLYSGGHGVELYNTTGVEICEGAAQFSADDNIHGTGTNTAYKIHGNDISHAGQDYPPVLGFGDGISFHDTAVGDIYDNDIHDNFKGGVANTPGTETEIFKNNLSRNFASVYAEGVVLAYHNIFERDVSDQYQKDIFTKAGYSGEAEFYNNVSAIDGSPVNGNIAVYCAGDGSETGSVTVKNHIFDGGHAAFKKDAACTTTLVSDYNAIHGFTTEYLGITGGENDITSDPLLDENYHILKGSPCIRAGIDVGITTDADGNTIPTGAGFDIGPYFYRPEVDSGYSPWVGCDSSLPTDGQLFKSHTMPIAAKKLTVFPGVATNAQISEAQ